MQQFRLTFNTVVLLVFTLTTPSLLSALLFTAQAQTLLVSTVNLAAERDRVQITAQGEVQELRLEVINPAGEVVFDSGPISAASLEWPLRDSQGERVPDGVYLCAISFRNSAGKLRKRIEQVAVSSQAPSNLESLTAPTPGAITGGGTTNQLTKFTGAYTIGDSVVSESGGKIGIATTAPSATLHINGFQPAASAANGTSAPTLLQTSGGKGGNTTGTTGQVAGAGASISLLAGNGGDAPAGSKRGNGGSITLQPGGGGGGLGSGGTSGNVLLAPTGGNVGVGTTTPAAKLTVAGVIQSTSGGLKFPDNTVQTTASKGGTITSVSAGTGLTGGGTSGGVSLGLASGGVGNTQLAANAVTADKVASGQVVKSLNSLKDNVTLSAGTNITITPAGNTLTIASTGLAAVSHDATLSGTGTSGTPLGVAVPLQLSNSSSSVTMMATNSGSGPALAASASNSDGVQGVSNGPHAGVYGVGGLFGVDGYSGSGIGVYGRTDSTSSVAGSFLNAGGAGTKGVAVLGLSASGSVNDINPNGNFDDAAGEFSGPYGVIGAASTDDPNGAGVVGVSSNIDGAGVYGYAFSTDPKAISYGVFGGTASSSPNSYAGFFGGNVDVIGTLSANAKNFKIDHPLDPANKYLYHTSVESPDMMNIYNGTVTLDQNGEATVHLPDYFEALNRDFRYQLTAIGAPGPNLYIAEEVTSNRFKIAGGQAGMKVSWQVTGIRQDAYANAHRTVVEEEKPERERGFYLHPELYGQPQEKSVEWARHPKQMRRMRAAEKHAN